MSIVVAVTRNGRTVMASDSMGFYGYQRVATDNSKAIKVRRVGPALLAMTGWSIYDNILDEFLDRDPAPPPLTSLREIFSFFTALWKELHDRFPFVNDQVENKDSPFGDLGSTFMVANSQGIFKVASDTNVAHFEKYYAIGSGSDYALGALHVTYEQEDDPARLAVRAVETAISFDTYCGGEIEVYEVPAGAAGGRSAGRRGDAPGKSRNLAAPRRRSPRR